MPRAQRWGRYCGGVNCNSITRICKQCGRSYPRDDDCTRYCSTDCREKWNYGRILRQKPVAGPCSYCGQDRSGYNAWDLCGEHYAIIQSVSGRLREHHVPIPLVHRLLTDETCHNPGCDTNILKPQLGRHGISRVNMAVDHDHTHCPGAASCGLCVRGLLCRNCNSATGMLRDDPERAKGIAEYLTEWTGSLSDVLL